MRHSTRPRRPAQPRSLRPKADLLETRELLTAAGNLAGLDPGSNLSPTEGLVAHPMYDLGPLVAQTTPPAGAFTPAQIRQAYRFADLAFDGVPADGAGQTIAIVVAYDAPTIQADLDVFNARFGLPPTTITRVNQAGGTSYPIVDPTGGWELEAALDVEWAHAIAPGAALLLVEASSPGMADMLTAVDYAAAHADIVSMSWGSGEFAGETAYNSHFSRAGVSFVAASGDSGAPTSWPASSPQVLAVGGTALTLGAGNAWANETGWSGSGGGSSAFEARPSYQGGVVTATTRRANPDVAYDAAPSTGFATYDSYNYNGKSYGWMMIGGTSAGAPQWAALLAIANQGRAAKGQPALNGAGPQEVMTTLYQNPAAFHDITRGTSTGSPNYSAGTGYDFVTGLGTPLADLVIGAFVGTVAAARPDTLALAGPATAPAGSSFSVTITARTAGGAKDTGYRGTVRFTSSDGQAGLPANYTFTTADQGSHTFTIALKTAGLQSITATDTVGSAVTGTLAGLTVRPAAASRLVLSGLPSTVLVGVSQTVTATARDAYGNVATGYTGRVRFTSSDAQAVLPADYTFTANDQGRHTFGLTFKSGGAQAVTIQDPTAGITATQSGIAVAPAAPNTLSARAASSTQINLTWTGSAGARGYLIERSSNGTSGWIQIGSTNSATTSYQDMGLSAATTYFYRVRAAAGDVNSTSSNVASGTTGAAPTAANSTLWSNSSVPSIDAYLRGSYELGVKFRSDVAGVVTGLRFYKPIVMGGFAHVGHLWASTGALLATAAFTRETTSGWQQVDLSSPVAIQANSVYVVSFSSGGGYFGISTNYFSTREFDSGALHALANGVSGGNGVFQYAGVFPSISGAGMNFWADVAFVPTSSTAIARAVALAAPMAGMEGWSLGLAPTAGASGLVPTRGPVAMPAGPLALGAVDWWSPGIAPPPVQSDRRVVPQPRTTTLSRP